MEEFDLKCPDRGSHPVETLFRLIIAVPSQPSWRQNLVMRVNVFMGF